jgi:hypothetical protein
MGQKTDFPFLVDSYPLFCFGVDNFAPELYELYVFLLEI